MDGDGTRRTEGRNSRSTAILVWASALVIGLCYFGDQLTRALAFYSSPGNTIMDFCFTELMIQKALTLDAAHGAYSQGFYQPGPLYFYLTAPFYVLLGKHLVAAGIAQMMVLLGFFCFIIWAITRLTVSLTEKLLLVLGLGLHLKSFSAGFSAPWNLIPTELAMLALLLSTVLTWCRHRNYLYGSLFFASFSIQTHAGSSLIAFTLAAMSSIAYCLQFPSASPRFLHRQGWRARATYLLGPAVFAMTSFVPIFFTNDFSFFDNLLVIKQSINGGYADSFWKAHQVLSDFYFQSYFFGSTAWLLPVSLGLGLAAGLWKTYLDNGKRDPYMFAWLVFVPTSIVATFSVMKVPGPITPDLGSALSWSRNLGFVMVVLSVGVVGRAMSAIAFHVRSVAPINRIFTRAPRKIMALLPATVALLTAGWAARQTIEYAKSPLLRLDSLASVSQNISGRVASWRVAGVKHAHFENFPENCKTTALMREARNQGLVVTHSPLFRLGKGWRLNRDTSDYHVLHPEGVNVRLTRIAKFAPRD